MDLHKSNQDSNRHHPTQKRGPVLSPLKLQGKALVSPTKHAGTTKVSDHTLSPLSPTFINAYGPPQPPPISPISAERKAAMLRAQSKKVQQHSVSASYSKSSRIQSHPSLFDKKKSIAQSFPTLDSRVSCAAPSLDHVKSLAAYSTSKTLRNAEPQIQPLSTSPSKTPSTTGHTTPTLSKHVHVTLPNIDTKSSVVPMAKLRYSPKRLKWVNENGKVESKLGSVISGHVGSQTTAEVSGVGISSCPQPLKEVVGDDRGALGIGSTLNKTLAAPGFSKFGKYADLGLGRPGRPRMTANVSTPLKEVEKRQASIEQLPQSSSHSSLDVSFCFLQGF